MVMVAVPIPTRGLLRQPEERKLGLRGSSTTGFVLEEARVPRHCLLGDPSTGKAQLDHTLAWGRTLMSAGLRLRYFAAICRSSYMPEPQEPMKA